MASEVRVVLGAPVLVVVLCTLRIYRGGAPFTVAEQWTETTGKEWQTWIDAFRDEKIARGFPYELRELVKEFGCPTEEPRDADFLPRRLIRLRAEAARILKRKKGKDKPPLPPLSALEDWETFARKLLIARFLAGEYTAPNAPRPTSTPFTEGDHA